MLSKPSPLQWECKYQVVFVPKRRRKAIFGNIRRQVGPVFHALAQQKECQIVEGHLMPDHVHMCSAIPPKHRELSASLHDSGRSGLVTSVVMLDRARRTDYDPQDAVGCTGRDATNLPAI